MSPEVGRVARTGARKIAFAAGLAVEMAERFEFLVGQDGQDGQDDSIRTGAGQLGRPESRRPHRQGCRTDPALRAQFIAGGEPDRPSLVLFVHSRSLAMRSAADTL
jgi:hypothetical protein